MLRETVISGFRNFSTIKGNKTEANSLPQGLANVTAWYTHCPGQVPHSCMDLLDSCPCPGPTSPRLPVQPSPRARTPSACPDGPGPVRDKGGEKGDTPCQSRDSEFSQEPVIQGRPPCSLLCLELEHLLKRPREADIQSVTRPERSPGCVFPPLSLCTHWDTSLKTHLCRSRCPEPPGSTLPPDNLQPPDRTTGGDGSEQGSLWHSDKDPGIPEEEERAAPSGQALISCLVVVQSTPTD